MKIDWGSKWIEFERGGKVIKLLVQEEIAKVTMCQTLKLTKQLKSQSEVLIAQICLCESKETNNTVHILELEMVLSRYSDVFEATIELLPIRDIDHRIPLLPNAKPVN